jgi:hypothetical protein
LLLTKQTCIKSKLNQLINNIKISLIIYLRCYLDCCNDRCCLFLKDSIFKIPSNDKILRISGEPNKNTTITIINNNDDYVIDKSKYKRKIKIVIIILSIIIIAYLIYTVIRRKNIVPYQLQVDN